MRYRALGVGGDYTVGKPFLVNSPDCVLQAVLTRLKLWRGEWFLNTEDGTPYLTEVLGKRFGNPDAAIKQRILATPGVTAIASYSSVYNGETRVLQVDAVIDTLYGPITFSQALR